MADDESSYIVNVRVRMERGGERKERERGERGEKRDRKESENERE